MTVMTFIFRPLSNYAHQANF